MIRKPLIVQLLLLVFIVFAAAGLSGCTLIADYDPILDQNITDLYDDINTFFAAMDRSIGGGEDGAYEKNTPFYDRVNGKLETIRARAAAIPKNDIVMSEIVILKVTIKELREIHETQGRLHKSQIDRMKSTIDKQFSQIIKLQNSLKRGK